MTKYRKKPIVVEAVQFKGYNWDEVISELQPDSDWEHNGNYVNIFTLEGVMRADIGDWIIKGVKGEIYPCKPDIFDATYEPVMELLA